MTWKTRMLAAVAAVAAAVTLFPAAPAAAETRASSAMTSFAYRWKVGISGAQISGIVGDTQHAETGGYHISREDILRTLGSDYSTSYSLDRKGPSNLASAVDITMPCASMKLVSRRLLDAMRAGISDMQYVRAFNGTLDCRSAHRWEGPERGKTTYYATADHLWHVHIEIYRAFAANDAALLRVLDVVLGKSVYKPTPIGEQAVIRCTPGFQHPAVLVLQRALNKVWPGSPVPVTGVCSSATQAKLYRAETRLGFPRSTLVIRPFWVSLGRAYSAI